MIDEATDRADDKTMLVMARHYDEKHEKVVTSFLSNPLCPRANADQLFTCINETMEHNDIPWNNVMGQSSDSASTMVGRYK